MKITVSEPIENDHKNWKRLYLQYGEFYKTLITEKTLKTVWSWLFDNKEPLKCLVAKNEHGEIVGLMHYREMPSPLRGLKIGFLDDLYILPAYRGQGIFTSLFNELKNIGESRNWPCIRWITGDDNYHARSAYDRIAVKTQWNTYQLDI